MPEPTALHPVATDRHLAPATGGVPAPIDEDEPARQVRADTQPAPNRVELQEAGQHRVGDPPPTTARGTQAAAGPEPVASSLHERNHPWVRGTRPALDDAAGRRPDATQVSKVRGAGIASRNLDVVVAEVGASLASGGEVIVVGVTEPRPDAIVGARSMAGVDEPEDIVEPVVGSVRHLRSNHRQVSCAVMAF